MLTKLSEAERMPSSVDKNRRSNIKLLAVIEATTVNAVAKNMLEFHRAARELNQKDSRSPAIETSFVTFDRQSNTTVESGNELTMVARDLGVEVDVVTEKGRFDLRVIPALREIVNRRAPDIVVTHQVKSHFLMKLSRLWRQYPWVAFHHGYTTTDRKMRAYNRLNRWSLPTADRVITVCEAFARELTVAGVKRERIHVEHNSIRPEQAVSTTEVEELRTRLGIGSDESIVLSVGRLSREKAHIDLLEAFKHVRDVNPEINARLVIVGDGVERDRLELAAESMGIRGRVIFAGEQSDVQPYYAFASLLVLPSHSEGSPYVLLEAMAAKVPIVATRVGGVPEIVEDEGSALLVPARDRRAMASAIVRVLANDELARKLTANAFTLAATRHSPDTQVRSLIELYDSVLTSPDRVHPATQ
jgi:glycosyltransferase involved in cell wall biosynthesis